ncbi:hypothetical protein RLEG12_11800 [Rhizobium leguminosarum bv. trifolii CB782]|uniref:hypothetical protein n=1 Tax=Rhizobium hidalgonense TaxID=1538159 RepID=UPI00027D35D4|nr:hypothetical protein [Rhizobium hidalgonense]AHG43867.1 hypothetical protein RLEG12_11800 [Rhizobium leguminosarum bv. trifolii CB782]EJC74463.1 hypothetical protein Rleg10DRAFT_2949 [Rhizobium leguminosarum bv. trifolii WSM2012]MDR9804621.1 hypothetical protein [Rhizobium hidalgonense]QKK25254.1 hypothetical protein FFM81_018760 [Rhizobium hidalgonense]RWX16549.1 hypothetical protein EHI42_12530 [Rhizobium hidalgonense]
MTTSFKTGLMAAALGATLGLSALSAAAAPLQSSATEHGATARPVAQETKLEHDRRTTGSIGERAESTGSTHYMMNPKKPLNMDCKLGFNPTSSSSCNY